MNIQGGFPLGLTGLISLLSKVLKGFLQHHNSKASILGYSAFFMVQLPHPYWKNHSFVGKVMSLLFNTVSRFVIAFLPRSKCLLISWLQLPSTVISKPPKIKSVTASTCPPFICHEVTGPDAIMLVFERWVLGQLFHSPLSPTPRGFLVPLRFLPLEWYHLYIWGCWYFSQQSWF